MDTSGWKRAIGPAAIALTAVAFFGLYATSLWDVDLWWHAATGRHIVASGELPERDPFGVYEVTGPAAAAILRGYWLMQLLLYSVLERLGAGGVIALKAALLVSAVLVAYRRCAALGAHPAAAALVTALAGSTLLWFTGERPQLASFLLVGVLFLLLDRYDAGRRIAWLLPVPLVMLVWANCHGGVALGAVLLALFAAAHAAERWSAWSTGAARERNAFGAVVALAFVLAVASPAGWNPFLAVLMFERSEVTTRISEYGSPFDLARRVGVGVVYPWGAMLGLAAAALVPTIRERRWSRAAVLLVLAGLSARTFRYVPFFVLVAGPYVAAGLTTLAGRVFPRPVAAHAALGVAAAVALAWGTASGRMFQRGIDPYFPAAEAAILASSGAPGKVMNALEWGGYLIWTLPPPWRMFIDGRNFDEQRFAAYTHIIWTTPYGREAFERERFDYVVMPRANRHTREEYTLNRVLLGDPRWRVLYLDARGYLFARVR